MALLGIFLLLTITGSILVSAYKDDIQKYILNYLNDRLDTKVNVRKISISMLRHFPYISATFNDVTILSSSGYRKAKMTPDTLLAAREVVLDVNIYNVLIKKNIKVDRVLVSDGRLLLAEGKNGKNNWSILRKSTDRKGKKVNVRLFRLKQISYRYESKKENFVLQGKINKGEWNEKFLTGRRGGIRITLLQDPLILSSHGKKGTKIPGPSEVTFLLYNGTDTLHMEKGRISIGKYPEISFKGFVHRGKTLRADMAISSGGMDMNEIFPLLTGKKSGKEEIRPGGKVSVSGHILLRSGPPFTWKADLDIGGKDHHFSFKKSAGEVRIVSWKGKVIVRSSQGKVITNVVVSPVKAEYGHSTFSGKVEWENSRGRPLIISVRGRTDLEDANVLFGGNRVFFKGTGDPDVKISIPVSLLKDPKKGAWKRIEVTGTMQLHDFAALLPGPLQGARATLKILPGHRIRIIGDHISGAGTQWKIDGQVYGLDDLFEKGTPVVIRGDLRASSADLEKVIGFFRSSGEEGTDPSGEAEENKNDPVILAGFNVDTLRYRELKVVRLQGALAYRDPVLDLQGLSFHTLEGDVNGQMTLRFLPGGDMELSTYGEMEHINVNRLFRSFHDFNQDFIRAENLKGRISGNIAFQAKFDSSGKVLPETILSDSYLKLEEGELINFEPLYKLSRFIRLSELKNIRFTRLENEIFIRDSRVIIPNMKVSSSAIDLDIAGTHYFDKHFEYRIRVYLSDYLARKARNANQDNGLDLVVEPGERNASLFLIYRGDAESGKVSYDKERTKKKISEEIKKEKEELRSLFRGKQQKDTLQILQGEEGEKTFRVVWPEEEKKKDTSGMKGKDSSSGKTFRVIWEEEPDTVPKKKDN